VVRTTALAAAATHTVVGLVCTPLCATGVAAPFTAALHGVTQFRVTDAIAQRKARPAA